MSRLSYSDLMAELKSVKDPLAFVLEAATKLNFYDDLVVALFPAAAQRMDANDKAAKIERRVQLAHIWARCPELRKEKPIGEFIKEVDDAIMKD